MEELNKTVSILTNVLEALNDRFNYDLTHGDCDSVSVTVAQICKVSHEITEAAKYVRETLNPEKIIEMLQKLGEMDGK